MPKLVLFRKAEVVAEYILGRKNAVTIGSARASDIHLNEKNISEHHCTVLKTAADKYEVKDNNTLTGTKINDRTVTSKELLFGDVITVGTTTLQYLPDRRLGKKEGDGEGELSSMPQYSLTAIYGQFMGKRYDLRVGETPIGRERISPQGIENSIVLAGDMTVSKGHAKITCLPDACSIKDVGSTGGVAVNGEKVGQLNSVTIRPGDEIAIGRTIFRFSEIDKVDAAPPRKHNIFFLKIRQPLMFLLTIALVGGGLFAAVQGGRAIMALNEKPGKMAIDVSRNWSAAGNTLRAAPADYDISGSPAIGDLNNDGINDIVYLSPAGLLYAWDGKEGAQLWRPVEISNPGKSSPVLADMNNDGILDIVVTADASVLYIVDGATGGIIRKEVLGGAIAEMSPCVCDLDGDGKKDVVAVSEEGMVHFVYAPGFEAKMQKFMEFVEGPVYASPVIITTKKIAPMVVVCSYNSKIFFLDGRTRSKKTVDLVEKTGKSHLMAAPPAVGDLNGDDVPEIVVQSNVPQYVSAIDIMGFNVNWTYFVEPIPPAGLKHHSSPVITDLNGDGMGDVFVVSANGTMYALKGKTGYPTGELLWKLDIPSPLKRTIATPALYDFDKNGIMDIVVGSEDGSLLFVKNSPKRKEMEVMSTVKASNGPITASVAIGDVNGDGLIEVVDANTINTVQVISTATKTLHNALVWPEYLANGLHSGVPPQTEDRTVYYGMIVGGLVLVVLVIVMRVLSSNKKANKRPRLVYV